MFSARLGNLATFLLLWVAQAASSEARAGSGATANPIRKVVNMLMAMQEKIEDEFEVKEDLYKKFMCYCQKSGGSLADSVAAAKLKIPQMETQLDEGAAEESQLKADIANHKKDRDDARQAIADAEEQKDKQSEDIQKQIDELKMNIAALEKAIKAVSTGMAGEFLQTSAATALRRIVTQAEVGSDERDAVLAFLEQSTQYAPQSGEILGILKQLKEGMEKDVEDLEAQLADALKNADALIAAKEKEVEALSKAIDDKMNREGALATDLAQTSNALEDTKEELAENEAFLADLDKNCDKKKKEWEIYVKLHSEEKLAISETIKILNEDDSLDLFKKTLPSPATSLLQVQEQPRALRKEAAKALRAGHNAKKDHRLDLLAIALRGGKVGFEKIIKMIEELIDTLKQEQTDDDNKKAWCQTEIDTTEDKSKVLAKEKADLRKALDNSKEKLASLIADLEAIASSIKQLDKDVAEQTEQRKEEHKAFVKTLSDNNQAKELLNMAKKRLNKFYLHKAKAAFQQVGNTAGQTPEEPPEADLSYSKQTKESSAVVQMINALISDLVKDTAELQQDEKDAQEEYEQFMADAKDKRALAVKTMNDKEGAKATVEGEIDRYQSEIRSKKKELKESNAYLASLHSDCDWLLKNFEIRREARGDEVDSLNAAKAVLSGADYSFLQLQDQGRKRISRRRS